MEYSLPQANNLMDFYAWMFVQTWFMPYYLIGKQDEWKEYFHGVTLNGIKSSNLCRPN
jgi:hypothetical protein